MEVYARRRARLAAQLGEGVLLLAGAHLTKRVNDVDHVFRQDSDVLYLTGFTHPDCVVVLSASRYLLFVQPRDRNAETWTGRRPGVEGAVDRYGADEAYPIGELAQRLPALIENVPRVYHRFGVDGALDRALLDALEDVRRRARKGVTAPQDLSDPYSLIHELRLRKSAEELDLLRRAAEISREAHAAAAALARPGAFEYQLEAELLYVFRARGGSGPAYPSIVAAGENATILHYTENCAPLRGGDLLLIDAGAEYGGYASDVTRTYPIGGRFEGAARDAYAAVLEAQRQTLAAVAPGTSLRALHDVAVRSLARSLVELGALEGDPDEIVAGERYQPYYMHSTSHFLGLDVHDVGRTMLDGKPRALEPGMVFTVEPGLYFRPDEPGCPDALRGVGVRIEDDVHVTEDGCEVLTESIPKEIDAVEAWVRSGDQRRPPRGG